MLFWFLIIWLSHAMGTVIKPFIVTQWPQVSEVTAGEDVILTCNIVELYAPCSTVAWVRVFSENATISFTDRVQMTRSNQETSMCTAIISNSTVRDSGMFYCTTVQGRFAHIGNGTKVIVKEHTMVPFIDILSPLIQNSPLVPLQCLVTGIESSQVQVSWVIEGKKEQGHFCWTHKRDDGIKLIRNQILITAEEWERKIQCVCVVQFAGQLYTKTLQRNDTSNVCHVLKYMYVTLCIIFSLLFLITVTGYVQRQKLEIRFRK